MSAAGRDFDNELSAYLDGELGDARRREVEQALAASPELRRRLEELREVSARLAELPRQAAPLPLRLALAELTPSAAIGGNSRRRLMFMLGLRVVSAAAAVGLFAFVGSQVYQAELTLDREFAGRAVQDAPMGRRSVAAMKDAHDDQALAAAAMANEPPSPADNSAAVPVAAVLPSASSSPALDGRQSPGESLIARGPVTHFEPDQRVVPAEGDATGTVRTLTGSTNDTPPGAELALAQFEVPTLAVIVRTDSPETLAAVRSILAAAGGRKDVAAAPPAASAGSGVRAAELVRMLVASSDAVRWIEQLESAAPQGVEFTLAGSGSLGELLRSLQPIQSAADSPGAPVSIAGADTQWRLQLRDEPAPHPAAAAAPPSPPGVRPAPATVPPDVHPREDRFAKLRADADKELPTSGAARRDAEQPGPPGRSSGQPTSSPGALKSSGGQSMATDQDVDGTAADSRYRTGAPTAGAATRSAEAESELAPSLGGTIMLRVMIVPPPPTASPPTSQPTSQPTDSK